jgi:DNA primase
LATSLDDVKRRILSRVQLADLIGERVKLVSRSGRPIGCCPFHAEKTPSFYVYDDRYYCYGCKAAGDAIEYVRKTEGISYPEALRYLAGKYGIEAPELDEARGRLQNHRAEASLYKMMATAQDFFVAGLEGEGGEAARAYLERRGFSPENVKTFGFGLTPAEGFGLVKHLRAKGYQAQDMIDCSLATATTRDGRPYDYLSHRITIPIREQQAR